VIRVLYVLLKINPTLRNKKMKPKLEILGAYKVECDESIRAKALSGLYPHCTSAVDKRTALTQIDAHLSALILFEIIIRDRDDLFNGGDFSQKGSDQCAYMERYLDIDGTSVIAKDFNVPPTSTLRLTFFLHFCDPKLPLKSSYGDYIIPKLTEIPTRLKALVQYNPVP